MDSPELADLLESHRDTLIRFLEREASGLMRYESAEDLAQGVHLRALKAADIFEYRGEAEFNAWMKQLARQHVAHRHEHWKALKRDAGKMLRISSGPASQSRVSGVNPAGPMTGPVTFTARKEQLNLAMRALKVLKERDRQIIHMLSEGMDTREIAEELDLEMESAQRAKTRAIERFEKAYEVLLRSKLKD